MLLRPPFCGGLAFPRMVMTTGIVSHKSTATRLRLLLAILLAALACVVFLPALKGQLLSWDDFEFIQINPRLHYLSWETVLDFFRFQPRYGSPTFALYVPLTLLSVALEYSFCGDAPLVYHCTNIVLHACNTTLVFVLALLLVQRTRVAFLTALFFAVHPLHVESVAWVTERKDVLCTLFYLLAMVAYLRWAVRHKWGWYAATVLAALCATLSKPLAVTLPLALLLCDYLLGRARCWARLVEKLPFFAMAVFGMAATLYVQGHAGAVQGHEALNLHGNAFVALRGVLFYVVKTIAPLALQPVYMRPQIIDVFGLVTLLSVAVTGGLLMAAWACRARARVVTFGIAFFFVTLAPMLQVLPSGLQVMAAPRFVYVPSIGFFLVLAWGADYLMGTSRRTRFLLWSLLTVLCLWWSLLTWRLATIWQTNLSLWSYTLAHQPGLTLAKTNLAIGHMLTGDLVEARRMYQDLLAEETNALLLANLATTCFNLGDISQAQVYIQAALPLEPEKNQAYYVAAAIATRLGDHTNALRLLKEVVRREPLHAEARIHIMVASLALGATNDAIGALQEYLLLERSDALAMLNLAHLYEQTQALSNAYAMYSRLSQMRPNDHNMRYRHGLMALRLRAFDAAYADFVAVTAAVPQHATALSDLALAERERGNPSNALACIVRAVALQPHSPKILYDYACILALQNRGSDAVVALTNALARDARLTAIARQDPDLACLRTNDAFRVWTQ